MSILIDATNNMVVKCITEESFNHLESKKKLPLKELPSVAIFLIIQNNKILHISNRILSLNYNDIDETSSWGVYAGIEDSSGKKDFCPIILFHGMVQGFNRYVFFRNKKQYLQYNATSLPSKPIKKELRKLYKNGDLINVYKLPLIDVYTN